MGEQELKGNMSSQKPDSIRNRSDLFCLFVLFKKTLEFHCNFFSALKEPP